MRLRASALFATLGLAGGLAACEPPRPPEHASRDDGAAVPAKPAPVDDLNAPTPYTAAQIRAANPVGRSITFVLETPDKPPVKQRMRFVDVDQERATVATETLDEKGSVLGQPELKISTWEDLQKHASYPRNLTEISDAVAETPAGSFPCKRYVVIEKTPQGESRTVACFANDLPGPPVEMTKELNGVLVLSMTLLVSELPAR